MLGALSRLSDLPGEVVSLTPITQSSISLAASQQYKTQQLLPASISEILGRKKMNHFFFLETKASQGEHNSWLPIFYKM